jgi:ABC-type nitrate/sulfonate/bicarbonate transport system substrate-binding protein
VINIIRALVGLIVTSAAISSVHAEDIVRLGHNRTWSNTALILGLANGDFSKFGVNVVEHEFTTPADIITAIASGDLDAGTVPAGNFFAAVSHGIRAKAVSVVQGRNNPPIAYMVRTDSGINAIADLRGKTAGVNNYGGNYDIYLRYWLKRGGLDPEKDVKIIIVPVPAMVPSLINKQVDIVPIASFDRVILNQRYPGQTKTLFDYDDVLKAATGNVNSNTLVLVMADEFIAKHRDVAINFMKGYIRAIRATNADPKKAVTEWASVVGNDMLRNLAGPPPVPDDGKIYPASLQFDADLTYQYGYLKTPIDVNSVVDNSVVDAALASLK